MLFTMQGTADVGLAEVRGGGGGEGDTISTELKARREIHGCRGHYIVSRCLGINFMSFHPQSSSAGDLL